MLRGSFTVGLGWVWYGMHQFGFELVFYGFVSFGGWGQLTVGCHGAKASGSD